jgi:hypothetical protein
LFKRTSEKAYSLLAGTSLIIVVTNIKGVNTMSNEEAEAIEENYDRWTAKRAKQDFIHRMERKLSRKERSLNRS